MIARCCEQERNINFASLWHILRSMWSHWSRLKITFSDCEALSWLTDKERLWFCKTLKGNSRVQKALGFCARVRVGQPWKVAGGWQCDVYTLSWKAIALCMVCDQRIKWCAVQNATGCAERIARRITCANPNELLQRRRRPLESTGERSEFCCCLLGICITSSGSVNLACIYNFILLWLAIGRGCVSFYCNNEVVIGSLLPEQSGSWLNQLHTPLDILTLLLNIASLSLLLGASLQYGDITSTHGKIATSRANKYTLIWLTNPELQVRLF